MPRNNFDLRRAYMQTNIAWRVRVLTKSDAACRLRIYSTGFASITIATPPTVRAAGSSRSDKSIT
jgi:hypothetical protein